MYTHKNHCRICGSTDLTKFLDLGDQPLANSFLKDKAEFDNEKKYPLAAYLCHSCNLAQLLDVVDKEEMFCDYIYFSSGMPKVSDHWRGYAKDVMNRFLNKNDLVVEIASNDGILLKFFQDSGYRVLGVDPAANITPIAEAMGVKTIVDFFSEKLADKIVSEYGRAKAILANNVVAHIDNHHDLVKGIAKLLAKDGVFVFEAPYLMDMFENLAYDTIYHEHLSFLSVRPLQKLFAEFGLELFDVEIHPVQGQSLRGFVGYQGEHPINANIERLVVLEKQVGLDDVQTYFALAKRAEAQKNKLTQILADLKAKGKKIAAYGAPAKGNTRLNYCQIGAEIIDHILEDLPAKQWLFTPGTHIMTVNKEYSQAQQPDYYLMLAWNYLKPIMEKEKDFINRGGKFIVPTEEIDII